MRDYGDGVYGAPRGRYSDLAFALPTLTVQHITRAGADITTVPATPAGDRFDAASAFVMIRNASDGTVTAIVSPTYVDELGNASMPIPVPVPAATDRLLGPFPRRFYGSEDGLADLALSDATDVNVAVLQLEVDR